MTTITELDNPHPSDTGQCPMVDWPLPLAASRVQLRAFGERDVQTFRSYRSDPEVARYQGWSTMTEEEARAFIDTMRDVAGPRAGAWIQLGIALATDDRLIGDIGLHLSPDGRTAQIGYTCATAFQRQGLASEAVHLLIDGVFVHTACEKIVAFVDTRNIASERLLIRSGFEPTDVQSVAYHGVDCVETTYELQLPRR